MGNVHELAGRLIGLHDSRASMVCDLGRWRSAAGGYRVRSTFYDGAWLIEIDAGSAPLEVHQVELDAGDLLAVQLIELELLHQGHPRLAQLEPDRGQKEAVFVDYRASSWAAWLPCCRCGGYRLTLPFVANRWMDDPDGVEGRLELELAREATLALMARFGGDACPGCNSIRLRSGEVDFSSQVEPMVWLDVLGAEPGWQLWMPLDGSGDGVTMPLGLPAWSEPEEVDEAAGILFASGRAEGRAEVRVYDWEEDEDDLG